MITQGMKCETPSCGRLSTHLVFWPGKIPVPRYCVQCMVRLLDILKASGYDDVQTRKIDERSE